MITRRWPRAPTPALAALESWAESLMGFSGAGGARGAGVAADECRIERWRRYPEAARHSASSHRVMVTVDLDTGKAYQVWRWRWRRKSAAERRARAAIAQAHAGTDAHAVSRAAD